MKKFIIIAMLAGMLGINASAQSYTRNGNTFTQVSKKSTTQATNKPTAQVYETSKGEKYPIYLSKNGRAYILRTSKNSGQEYKQYLGEEISREVCKLNGVTYVERKK